MSSQFTDEQLEVIYWTNGITTGLSLLGELFMIISFLAVPTIRRFSMKLVLSLTVTDLAYSIANVLTYFNHNESICIIEGIIRTWAVGNGVGWTLGIMIVSYQQVMSPDPNIDSKYKKYCVTISTIAVIPTILGVIGQYTNQVLYFAPAMQFCSLVPINYAFYLIQVPKVICIIITFVLTIKIIREMRRRFENKNIAEYKTLLLYPLLLVVCWIPGTIDRLIFNINGGAVYYSLVCHILSTRIQGFLDALVYGKSEFQRIKNHFRKDAKKIDLRDSTERLAREIYLQTNMSYSKLSC